MRKKAQKVSPVEQLFKGVTFKDLLVPIAIIAGSLIIGGSVIVLNHSSYSGGNHWNQKGAYGAEMGKEGDMVKAAPTEKKDDVVNKAALVAPVTENDHVRGGADAKVTLVEYSDLDCPFCARAHSTLQALVDEYDGEVAWVYRHFPLTSLHPNANAVAQASECVANEGGSEAFWDFVDGYFAGDIGSDLTGIQAATGVSAEIVEPCVENGTFASVVSSQSKNARATGGSGTPWTVLIGPNGSYDTVSGAQPIAAWRTKIDALLAQ